MPTPFMERKGSPASHSSSGTQAWQQAQEARRLKSRITPSAIVAMLLCIVVAVVVTKKMEVPSMNRFITALLQDEERSKTVVAAVAAIAGLLAMALAAALRIGFLST